MSRTVLVEPTLDALTEHVAREVVATACAAIAAHGRFTWMLSGGSTPRGLFARFGSEPRFRDAIDWTRVHFFWSDERHVGPDHPDSNFRMARETMLAPLAIPAPQIHRMLGELETAEDAARAYDIELVRFFDLATDSLPRFDLALLGMGDDGHTASLFPGSPSLESRDRVLAPWVESLKAWRITLGLPVLNAASRIIVLVAGEGKAAMVKRVLDESAGALPARLLDPRGDLTWALDGAAARLASPP